MTNRQRLELEQSEKRQKINEFLGKETLTDKERTELDVLTKRMQTLEPELRAAIIAEPEKPATDPQFTELANRVEFRNFLHEAATGICVSGAEKELRDEIFKSESESGKVPWEALLPMRRNVEKRADAATTIGSTVDVPINQESVMGRVFAESSTVYLGAQLVNVPTGDAGYASLTAGATGSVVARGTDKDAEAATFSVETLSPKRLSCRYLVSVEDLARLRGMEESLRADCRAVLANALDNATLNGDGTAPNPSGLFTKLTAPDDPGSTNISFSDFISQSASGVDGKLAVNLQQVRTLYGVGTFQKAASVFTTNGDVASSDYLRTHSNGIRVSANITAPDPDVQQALIHRTGGDVGPAAVVPVWSGLEILVDPYTHAASGRRALTASMLFDFGVIRTAAYKSLKFKLS